LTRIGTPTTNLSPRYNTTAKQASMFRFTRPLLQVSKISTGIHGLAVHPNPLPELIKTYESTLTALTSIPEHAAYRQGAEALTSKKLKIVQDANGDIAEVERQLDEGQIEQAIAIANDELGLVGKMAEWKAYVSPSCISVRRTTDYGQMGASGREARTRTVGVLWKNIDCILAILHWALCFQELGEKVVRYLTMCVPPPRSACATRIPHQPITKESQDDKHVM
jgi:NADH dehydrogenase (ubiquinone) 1 alpha subcomplex subunit 5